MWCRLTALPILLLLAFLPVLGACGSTGTAGAEGSTSRPAAGKQPLWVDNPTAGIDTRRYLVAVGSHPELTSVDKAKAAALRQINESLLASVRSESESFVKEYASNQSAPEWVNSYMQRVNVQSQGDLPASDLREQWQDPKGNSTWVRVVVDRELTVKQWVDPAMAQLEAARSLLRGLQDARHDLAREVRVRVTAHNKVAATFTNMMRALAASRVRGGDAAGLAQLTSEAYEQQRSFLVDVKVQLGELAALMQIVALSGNNQTGDAGYPLSKPLTGQVLMEIDGQDTPLAELPVVFIDENGKAARATTDSEGSVALEPVATGVGQVVWTLALDLGDLGATPSAGLVHARFVYHVRTRSETRIAVVLRADASGGLVGDDSAGLLAGRLTALGFRASAPKGLGHLGLDQIRDRLRQDHQFGLVGEVSMHPRASSIGTVYEASGEFQVVHFETGKSFTIPTKPNTSPNKSSAVRQFLTESVGRNFDGFARQIQN